MDSTICPITPPTVPPVPRYPQIRLIQPDAGTFLGGFHGFPLLSILFPLRGISHWDSSWFTQSYPTNTTVPAIGSLSGSDFERYSCYLPSHSVFYMFLPEGIFVLFKFHIRIFAKSRKSQLQFFGSLETINYSFIFSVHFFKLQNLLFSIRGTFCTFLSFRMFYFTSFSFYILLFYSTKFFFLLHTDLCFSTKTSNSFPFISNLDLFHFYKTLSRSFPSISFYDQCRTFYRIKLHNFLFS